MKKRKELNEKLEPLRREREISEDEQPRLVLRVGPEGLELVETEADDAGFGPMVPRQFEATFVPGPKSVQ